MNTQESFNYIQNGQTMPDYRPNGGQTD